MDADRAGALTGNQLGSLIEAMLDAFVGRDEIEMLLTLRLDKLPDLLVSDGGLKSCIYRLIRTAKSEGWLADLINAVVEERAGNAAIKAWLISINQMVGNAAVPQAQQLIDTVYFDLIELRKAVARAKKAATGRVMAFGITYSDAVFVRKLCDWLGPYLGETQLKEPLNLLPELAPVSKRLRHAERYRPELDSANVLCVVYIEGVPVETVAEFWDGVCSSFDGIKHYFALVFAGYRDAVFPPGVTALPPPQFDISDVDLWTHEMVRLRGWPVDLADAWTELLRDDSMDDNILDVRSLYEAMDRSIREMRFNSDDFRRRLEERTGHAYAAPN